MTALFNATALFNTGDALFTQPAGSKRKRAHVQAVVVFTVTADPSVGA